MLRGPLTLTTFDKCRLYKIRNLSFPLFQSFSNTQVKPDLVFEFTFDTHGGEIFSVQERHCVLWFGS